MTAVAYGDVERTARTHGFVTIAASVPLFIFAPYLDVGGYVLNGALVAMALLFLSAPWAFAVSLRQPHVYRFGSFYVALGVTGAFLATFYGVSNLTVVKMFVSVAVYVVFGSAVSEYLSRAGTSFESALIRVLQVVLAAIAFNSALVIVEFFVPTVRAAVEGVLANTGDNIDYRTHPFRLRGLASAGGAALSVLHGLGCAIALTLVQARQIRPRAFLVAFSLCAFSCLFIGRTGFIVIVLAVAIFAASNLRGRQLRVLGAALVGLALAVWLAARLMQEFIPREVQEYSLLFFFAGIRGLEQEGTFDVVRSFLFLPDAARHLLFGIGYFGGVSIIGRPTDSGYLRMILSFGIPLAIAAYVSLAMYMAPVLRPKWARMHVLPVLLILLIVEIKEPMMFQVYTSRLLFLLGGIGFAYRGRVSAATVVS